MKKHLLYIGLASSTLLSAVSCSEDVVTEDASFGTTEINIHPYIGAETRLDNTKDNDTFDARIDWKKDDPFILTYIGRTTNPIAGFQYYDKEYKANRSQGWMPQFQGKLYWTDSKKHTFIGYSKPTNEFQFAPKADDLKEEDKNKWDSPTNGLLTYYGTLGENQEDDSIEETTGTTEAGTATEETTTEETTTEETTKVTKGQNYRNQDLLLTYADSIQADATGGTVTAKLKMKHAMAKVKIVLNINGFAWTADATEDLTTKITNLALLDQPVNFQWDQKSANVTVTKDTQTENIIAWKAAESGDANEKTFIAYALVVPGEREFDVAMELKYSDVTQAKVDGKYPLKANLYKAHFGKDEKGNMVKFTGGERTTLNITLTHLNEAMIVKATYNDWVEVDLNDRTQLQTKTIFLSEDDLTKDYKLSTTAENTNIEKCDWLYKDTSNDGKIKDCYGNDGSKAKPYLIKYAQELMAFKKEVENGNTFKDKYVKLFTDIYLQPSNTENNLVWKSIGTDDEGKTFAGTFDGNYSAIQSLVSAPLFNKLASTAKIEHLTVQTFDARKKVEAGKDGGATDAILCKENNGTIMGCAVNGSVKGDNAAGITVTNNGAIYACYHQGAVTGTTTAAGLVNTNKGTIQACYQAGGVTATTASGVIAKNEGDNAKAGYCYYDTFLAPNIKAVGTTEDEADGTVKGENIDKLKVQGFQNTLNEGITAANDATDSTVKIDVRYIQNPGDYPTLEPGQKN